MHIPKNPSHHHFPWGTDSSPTNIPHELLDNPITYEIILIIAVVSFAMLLLLIMRCLRSLFIAAADDYYYYYGDQQGDEEEARPLTADGDRIDNEDGGKTRRYGTFYVDNGKWYTAEGYVFPMHEK
jgi:hypothetical protein